MHFANPWGLLSLVALPVILVIHLYHRRYPTLMVAGLHLWGVETHTTTAGRTRERLPITRSLLLELLAALVLSLVLSDPRWGDIGKVVHLVVVLDNSASMSSKPPGLSEKSFRDAAVDELEQRVQKLPRGSVVTLLQTGRRPEMLAGPAIEWDEAKRKLAEWQPALPKHDFQATWDLAAQLSADTGELLFLTDVVPDEKIPTPKSMEVVSVGKGLANVSISAARWDFHSESGKGRVFVRLTNHGQRASDAQVIGSVGEPPRQVFASKMELDGGASVPLEVEVPGGLGRLVVTIESIGDGLPLDNRVELIEPKVRTLHYAISLPKDSPATRHVQRVLQSMPDVSLTNREAAELLIGPALPMPPSRRELWWLGIGPVDTDEEGLKSAKDLIGPFVLERQNPLLDGMTLNGVVWGGAQPLKLDLSPIITSGALPLLSRINGTRSTAYLLNIDFAKSNLAESPDWPILLSNLVELRRDNLSGLRRWNYRLNEEIRFRLAEDLPPVTTSDTTNSRLANTETESADSRPLVLIRSGQKRPLARTTIVEVPPLDETGLYSIVDGERLVGEFAVNFHDTEESTLNNLRPGHRQPTTGPTAAAGFQMDQPLTWMILLGIAVITLAAFADWHTLRPVQRRG